MIDVLDKHNKFEDVVQMIKQAQSSAFRLVNTVLIDLYWQVGKYVSEKSIQDGWGKSTVIELADFINYNTSNIKGFSDKNIWRMKQFYETYKDIPKLSTLLREISWSNNLTIMSRAKTLEEKEFYMRHCIKERYSARELQRQISASLFERAMLSNTKLSPVAREIHPNITNSFRDSYVFEFFWKTPNRE